MNDIYNTSILDLLPPSMVHDQVVLDTTKVIDHFIQDINKQITQLIILPNIDHLDHEMLDILSVQFRAPFYSNKLDLSTKRQLIKNSINWHRTKGTVAALEEVVSTVFGGESQIVEWYEYGGKPHHFKIVTTHVGTDGTLVEEFKKVADTVKRKSSVLEEVIVLLANRFSTYYGFVVHTGDNLIIRQEG